MLTREYTSAGHVNRITLTKSRTGWDVREERDDTVVKRAHYSDWHRVERAIQDLGFRFTKTVKRNPRSLLHEPIAQPDDGFDLAAGRAELRPEPADVHVHGSGFDELLVAPHPLEQPIA